MPWKEMDERLRFVARLLDGEAISEVCREFGISRKTGYEIFGPLQGTRARGPDRSLTPTGPLRQPADGEHRRSGNPGPQPPEASARSRATASSVVCSVCVAAQVGLFVPRSLPFDLVAVRQSKFSFQPRQQSQQFALLFYLFYRMQLVRKFRINRALKGGDG